MNKTFITTLLAATMLVPAVADAQDAPPCGDGGGRPEAGGRGPGGGEHPRPAGGWQGARPDWRGERPQRTPGQPDARPDRGPGGGIDRPRPDGGWRGARPDWRNQQPQPFRGEPGAGSGERPAWSQDRPDRGPRDPGADRPDRPELDARGERPPLAQGRPDWRGGNWNPQRNGDGVAVHRGDDNRGSGDPRRWDDRRNRDDRRHADGGRGWDGNRAGWDRRAADRSAWDRSGWVGSGSDRGAWNRDWRADRRYDWNRYRGANRAAYRLPHYYAPSGWGYGYRRFTIGATLWSGLWGSNYWIDDPFEYRLPEAYGPYRWVRYYDDALLVDVRSGRVVDVVYDIFW